VYRVNVLTILFCWVSAFATAQTIQDIETLMDQRNFQKAFQQAELYTLNNPDIASGWQLLANAAMQIAKQPNLSSRQNMIMEASKAISKAESTAQTPSARSTNRTLKQKLYDLYLGAGAMEYQSGDFSEALVYFDIDRKSVV